MVLERVAAAVVVGSARLPRRHSKIPGQSTSAAQPIPRKMHRHLLRSCLRPRVWLESLGVPARREAHRKVTADREATRPQHKPIAIPMATCHPDPRQVPRRVRAKEKGDTKHARQLRLSRLLRNVLVRPLVAKILRLLRKGRLSVAHMARWSVSGEVVPAARRTARSREQSVCPAMEASGTSWVLRSSWGPRPLADLLLVLLSLRGPLRSSARPR